MVAANLCIGFTKSRNSGTLTKLQMRKSNIPVSQKLSAALCTETRSAPMPLQKALLRVQFQTPGRLHVSKNLKRYEKNRKQRLVCLLCFAAKLPLSVPHDSTRKVIQLISAAHCFQICNFISLKYLMPKNCRLRSSIGYAHAIRYMHAMPLVLAMPGKGETGACEA